MIELLFFIGVIILVVVAIKLCKQDNAPAARPYCLPDGIKMARQRAVESGDTEAVQAIDNGTYKELLEQRASKRQASAPDGVEYCTFDIAGINYRKGIADYVGQSTGYLKPQPTNRHDPKAITIYSADGHHLGYIRANDTGDVRALRLRFPIPVSVSIEECYDDDENRRFYVGKVTIKYKKNEKDFAISCPPAVACLRPNRTNTNARKARRVHLELCLSRQAVRYLLLARTKRQPVRG